MCFFIFINNKLTHPEVGLQTNVEVLKRMSSVEVCEQ